MRLAGEDGRNADRDLFQFHFVHESRSLLGSNLRLRVERQATNHLNYVMAIDLYKTETIPDAEETNIRKITITSVN
jgi:hypothetical protein